MSIAGILTQAQATDINLAASVKQWIYQNVIVPYNAAIPDDGIQLQGDGAWKQINTGLQVIMGGPTDDSLYEFVPVVGYVLDDKENSKDPVPTGCGDLANWEYRSIGMCVLPGMITGTTDGMFQANRKSRLLLGTLMANAFLRTKILPIVDASQAPTNPLPQIGYAEITQAYTVSMGKDIAVLLAAHKLRFDVHIEIRWAVQGTN